MISLGENGHCINPECECHTTDRKVTTPFPLDMGPAYCCNRCSSERSAFFGMMASLGLATREGQKLER